jgi:hypothetical protein
MGSTITRIKLAFVGVFFVACAGVWAYQVLYVWPRDKCESGGGWFDPRSRQCGRVIYIPDVTGRYVRNGREQHVKLPSAAALKAAEAPRSAQQASAQ